MRLNGTNKAVIMTVVLTSVVTIFVMLFTGITGSVESVQAASGENRERIVAVEVDADLKLKADYDETAEP